MPVRPLLEIGALVGLLASGRSAPTGSSDEPGPPSQPPTVTASAVIDPDTIAPVPDEHGRYLMNLSPVEVTAVLAVREVRTIARSVVRRVRGR